MTPNETIPIRDSDDIVRVRSHVRTLAISLGLGIVDQTKIVTAASELARNTLDYGGGGGARLEIVESGAPGADGRLYDRRRLGFGLKRRKAAL